ncbi:putative ankyrin repeat protein [Fusarium bulbicola]|nr:putative ankyrin repeat protein [Fusarium bulbicola]
MIQTLLERMDNLLDDESPVANHQEVAPLVDDALLRLKVWSHELHKRNPQALDMIRAEDPELHTMISGLKTGIMFQVKKVMESKGKATTEPKHLSLRSDETEEETIEQLLDTMKRAWVPLAHSSGAEPRPGFWLFRKDTREELKAAFMNMLAFSLFVLKFIIFWVKRASKDALRILNSLNPSLTRNSGQRVNQNHQSKSPEDFLINIEKSFQGTATERLLKGNPDFVRKLAEKAAALEDSEEHSIWKGGLLAKTAQVNLHQQVLYCGKHNNLTVGIIADTWFADDSSSIGRENRWTVQNELIYRIARVTTRLLPEGEGIYLRYINQDVPESGSLRFDEMPNITKTLRPAGGTPIGTNLRSKVLNPFVYKRLPYDLKRPLLITVITNGAPSIEQKSAFVEAIKECGDKLEQNNLPRESVKFLVGRVGTAKAAKAFLDELRRDSQIAKVLFVATGKTYTSLLF